MYGEICPIHRSCSCENSNTNLKLWKKLKHSGAKETIDLENSRKSNQEAEIIKMEVFVEIYDLQSSFSSSLTSVLSRNSCWWKLHFNSIFSCVSAVNCCTWKLSQSITRVLSRNRSRWKFSFVGLNIVVSSQWTVVRWKLSQVALKSDWRLTCVRGACCWRSDGNGRSATCCLACATPASPHTGCCALCLVYPCIVSVSHRQCRLRRLPAGGH